MSLASESDTCSRETNCSTQQGGFIDPLVHMHEVATQQEACRGISLLSMIIMHTESSCSGELRWADAEGPRYCCMSYSTLCFTSCGITSEVNW